MIIFGFLKKKKTRITVFKDKNKYILHDITGLKEFHTKKSFDEYSYSNRYKFIGINSEVI